jgi:hypothetical protein
MAEGPIRGMFGASAGSEQVEELQFTVGEGPCIEAFSRRRPVLLPELDVAALARWPAYIPFVHALGVRAIFAFPLQIGAARLGALDVFRAEPAMLPEPNRGWPSPSLISPPPPSSARSIRTVTSPAKIFSVPGRRCFRQRECSRRSWV